MLALLAVIGSSSVTTLAGIDFSAVSVDERVKNRSTLQQDRPHARDQIFAGAAPIGDQKIDLRLALALLRQSNGWLLELRW
jgi:hypothetical protein